MDFPYTYDFATNDTLFWVQSSSRIVRGHVFGLSDIAGTFHSFYFSMFVAVTSKVWITCPFAVQALFS